MSTDVKIVRIEALGPVEKHAWLIPISREV